MNCEKTEQATRMINRAKHKCPPSAVGDSVQIPIPEVDQGPIDPSHIICFVVKVDKKKVQYLLGNKHGVLSNWLPANAFGQCKQSFIDIKYVYVLNRITSY